MWRAGRIAPRGLVFDGRGHCLAAMRGLSPRRQVVCGVRRLQLEHALDVPSHGDEAPLAARQIEPAHHELAEPHHRFDDAEHRFRRLLAQGVEFSALGRSQPLRHRGDRRRVFGRGRGRREPLAQGGDGAAGGPRRLAARSPPFGRPSHWPRCDSPCRPAAWRVCRARRAMRRGRLART